MAAHEADDPYDPMLDPQGYLVSAGPADGGFGFNFRSDVVPMIAEALAECLRDSSAENYVTWEIDHAEFGPLVLRLQRRWGETPERQLATSRARIARAHTALADAPDLLLEDYSKRQVKALVAALGVAYAELDDVPPSQRGPANA